MKWNYGTSAWKETSTCGTSWCSGRTDVHMRVMALEFVTVVIQDSACALCVRVLLIPHRLNVEEQLQWHLLPKIRCSVMEAFFLRAKDWRFLGLEPELKFTTVDPPPMGNRNHPIEYVSVTKPRKTPQGTMEKLAFWKFVRHINAMLENVNRKLLVTQREQVSWRTEFAPASFPSLHASTVIIIHRKKPHKRSGADRATKNKKE